MFTFLGEFQNGRQRSGKGHYTLPDFQRFCLCLPFEKSWDVYVIFCFEMWQINFGPTCRIFLNLKKYVLCPYHQNEDVIEATYILRQFGAALFSVETYDIFSIPSKQGFGDLPSCLWLEFRCINKSSMSYITQRKQRTEDASPKKTIPTINIIFGVNAPCLSKEAKFHWHLLTIRFTPVLWRK